MVMLKSHARQIAEMDEHMVNAVESIHELEQEIAFLKGVLEGRQKSKMKFNGDADFRAPVDGTLSCGNLSLKVREGYTSDEMDALMEVGEEMIEWLEEKGIELDGQGTGDDN